MGKRILVEGIMHLGDLIASSAIIGPLKREYPDSHITYLITPGMETAIESMPQVDDYIVYRYKSGGDIKGVWELSRKMKRGNYDIFVSFDPRDRTAIAALLGAIPVRIASGSVFGWHVNGFKRSFYTNFVSLLDYDLEQHLTGEAFLESVNRLFATSIKDEDRPCLEVPEDVFASFKQSKKLDLNSGSYVCLCLSTVDSRRSWPSEYWSATIEQVITSIGPVVLVGTKEDFPLAEATQGMLPKSLQDNVINLCGKTSLQELFAVLQNAKLTMNIDNGIGHMAAALDCPTITLFPTKSPKRFLPMGKKAQAVVPHKQGEQIELEQVLAAVKQF